MKNASSTRLFVVAGLLLAFALVLFVSPFANGNPDGLKVSLMDKGSADTAAEHRLGDSPVADYSVSGVETKESARVCPARRRVVTFALGLGLFGFIKETPRVGSRCSREVIDLSGGHTHGHGLLVHGHSRASYGRAAVQGGGGAAFVLIVVATPREAFWAYGVYAGLASWRSLWCRGASASSCPPTDIETPFLLFVIALPFIARGERVDFRGLDLSVEGLWAAWNILGQGNARHGDHDACSHRRHRSPRSFKGFSNYGCRPMIVSIAGFMVRYVMSSHPRCEE